MGAHNLRVNLSTKRKDTAKVEDGRSRTKDAKCEQNDVANIVLIYLRGRFLVIVQVQLWAREIVRPLVQYLQIHRDLQYQTQLFQVMA